MLRQEPEVGVELALDGSVQLTGRDLVNVNVTFTYAAPPSAGTGNSELREVHPPRVTESIAVVLRSGRPLLVSRSADPVTNRTVSVELTATIMEP